MFGLIAAFVVSTALSFLLRPRIKRPQAPDLDYPKAEEGLPVPLVYGTQAVSPLISAVGEVRQVEQGDGETFYEWLATGDLCLGEIDEIVDIQFGGKSLRLHPLTKGDSTSATSAQYAVVVSGAPTQPGLPYTFTTSTSVTFDVNARTLFGGPSQEGGVERVIRIHRGALFGSVDPVTAHLWDLAGLPGGGTGNPGVASITFGDLDGATPVHFYGGTVPQPKPPVVILRVIPNALGLGAIGINANPAEILYDLLTHPLRGRGVDASLVDTDSFIRAGSVCASENLGLSCTFSRQQETQDMIEDVGRHIHGDCYQSAITGLWTMVLARADYLPADLLEVNRQTATDLVVTRPSWRPTTNEVVVTYRKYDDTPFTEASVVGEALTPPSGIHLFGMGFPPYTRLYAWYVVKGRDITNVTVHNVTRSTDLVAGTHYRVLPAEGRIDFGLDGVLPATGELEEGDVLTIDYTNGAEVVGYKEASEPAQDLANQQATQEVRSEAVERPFFTNPIDASIHAWRELKLKCRPLADATWTATRADSSIKPGDVRAVTWVPEGWVAGDFALDRVPFRVVKVDYGELARGAIKVTAVEDVFGASVAPSLAAGKTPAPVVKTAPPVAAIYCLGADEVALQASDVNFPIHLQRADDTDGTGAEDVEESPLPGTTTTYVDATTGKTHRARLVRDGWLPGPWTPWVAVCTTGEVGCVLPAIVDTPLVDGMMGTLVVEIDDPQLRLQRVEFQITTALGVVGDWTTDIATPYEASVPLVVGRISYIRRRVWYFDCDADLISAEAAFPFEIPVVDPDPNPDDGGSPVTVPIELLLSDGLNVLEIPSELTDLVLNRDGEVQFPIEQFGRMRLFAGIKRAGTVGSYLQGRFEVVSSTGVYGNIGVDDLGPKLDIDEDSLAARDLVPSAPTWVVAGDWYLVRPEAKGDVRLKVQIAGGDDATGDFYAVRLSLQLDPRLIATTEPPEVHDPPPDDPGSCDVPAILDDLTYADLTALNAAWPVD